jgi:hypothetical protein
MEKKYLIGKAELLTSPIGPRRGGRSKEPVYTYEESRARLKGQLESVLEHPISGAKEPDGVCVLKFSLHPNFIAKSYYPKQIMRSMGFESVGSRSVDRKSDKDVRGYEEKSFSTSEIFVAATREKYENLLNKLKDENHEYDELSDIVKIQEISHFSPEEKIKSNSRESNIYEIVLHLPSDDISPHNKEEFLNFVKTLGGVAKVELAFKVDRLWFIPVQMPPKNVRKLAGYSTLRVIRPMPNVEVTPIRSLQVPQEIHLPKAPEVIDGPNVAILDGGLPEGSALHQWIHRYEEKNPVSTGVKAYEEHGHAVCSAFLFGPLNASKIVEMTRARIHFFRVLDESTQEEDEYELYKVLGYIQDILLSGVYEFINLSLGPNHPIEDNDVHAWTAVIDSLLCDGKTVLTVAAGNNGEFDRASGNARIQVPSDAVNALAVGSCDRSSESWKRAPYSAMGPGRFPGRIKPDVLAFGGSESEDFNTVSPDGSTLLPVMGTSFAAPFALRQAVNIKNLFGDQLSMLGIKTLLIHSAEPGIKENHEEYGWGRIPMNVEDMVSSGAGAARIIYQGSLTPGKYLRASIPKPEGGYQGMVKISATFCFATLIDPQSPDVYTRSALDITFRPKQSDSDKETRSTSRPFFRASEFSTESRQRSDEGKWENVLHATKNFQGSTLTNPVFDIHYNARLAGAPAPNSYGEKMQYALVITVEAAKHTDLHDELLANYPQLEAFTPQISISADSEIRQNIE